MINQSVVIIPTYNEALNVQLMIEKLLELYPGISVLIIDDNSPDMTSLVVETLQTIHPNIFLIKRSAKLGLGTAYTEGFEWALLKKFTFIIQMDCDFSHDPKDVQNLFNELINQNADLAIGSRYSGHAIRTENWPLGRLVLSYSAAFMLRILTGLKIRDALGGFKGFRREALEKLNLKNIISKGYVFQFEINYKIHTMGYKIIEVPIIFSQRTLGESKMNIGIIIEAALVILQLRFKKLTGKLNL